MMKTDKWKIVINKNPNLRRLRKNLRTVIKLAVYDERRHLRHIRRLYLEKIPNLTPSQKKRNNNLLRLSNELSEAYDQSILRCLCGAYCLSRQKEGFDINKCLDLDMVWNPLDRAWICINCYNFYFGSEETKEAYKEFLLREKAQDEYLAEKYGLGTPLSEEEDKELDKILDEISIHPFSEDKSTIEKTDEMKRYEAETGRYAIWRGHITEGFKKYYF